MRAWQVPSTLSAQSQIMWLLPASSQPIADQSSASKGAVLQQQVVDQCIAEAVQAGVEDLTAFGPEDWIRSLASMQEL